MNEREERIKKLLEVLANSKGSDFEATFQALAEIYTEEYWRDMGYNSFKEYVFKENECSQAHYYRLEAACEDWKQSPVGDKPRTERHSRGRNKPQPRPNPNTPGPSPDRPHDTDSPMGENETGEQGEVPEPKDDVETVKDLVDKLLTLFANSADKPSLVIHLQPLIEAHSEFYKKFDQFRKVA